MGTKNPESRFDFVPRRCRISPKGWGWSFGSAPSPTPLGAFISFRKIGDNKKMPEKINAQIDYDTVLVELYAKRDEIETTINTILFLQGSGSSASVAAVGVNGG